MPEPTSASITACMRLLAWFDAAVTSGAVASVETLTVNVSGVPCTSPEPMTVTCLAFGTAEFDVGVGCLSHADNPAIASPATAITMRLFGILAQACNGIQAHYRSGLAMILQCWSGSARSSNAVPTSRRPTVPVIIGATSTSPSAMARSEFANSVGS